MCTAHAKIIKIIFLNSIYHKIILMTQKYDSHAIIFLQFSFYGPNKKNNVFDNSNIDDSCFMTKT